MTSAGPGIDVDHFAEFGWVLAETLDEAGAATVRGYVDEIAAWPDEGEWLHYRELTDHGPKLCRTEKFTPFHAGLRALLTTGAMIEVASALLGEQAVLYKEKINYKLAGGAGYAPHQDAPAYRFVDRHVSCMVAVDDATIDNGCLEVVSGRHHEIATMDERSCIAADVVASMTWELVPLRAGQTLWFHSMTPHRSGPNHTETDRRALYPTYNALAEGDLRARYYAQKQAEFAAAAADPAGVQVSLIGDFQGRRIP